MVTMSDTPAQPLDAVTPVTVNPNNHKMNPADATRTISSDYEKCREERIKENLERMQKLGIYDLSLKLKSVKPNNSNRRNNKPFIQNKTPNRCISPLPSNVPTRRSSRLQNTPIVTYTEDVLPKKGKNGNEILLGENSRAEIYTEEHEKLLGEAKTEWTLFVDGFGKDGKKIYDQIRGKTCHQCRQKTLGHRTHCIQCNLVQGQFCGDCLYMRYGENVLEAQQNPEWICPPCRGICNCSLCRQAKGWAPTGMLYRKISNLGYKSVAHYLIQTRRSDPNEDKNETQVGAKRSLPFSSEQVEIKDDNDAKIEHDNLETDIRSEDDIATNEDNNVAKSEELKHRNSMAEIKSDGDIAINEEVDDANKENIEDLKYKNSETEIKSDDKIGSSDELEIDEELKDKNLDEGENENENKNKVDKCEVHLELPNKVNKTDDEVKTTPKTKVVSRKKRCSVALENSIAGRLRSRRKCT